MNTIELRNGVRMPQMGYGVYQVSPSECERCVSDALEVGSRIMSWGPLAEGRNGFFTQPLLAEIGAQYGKTIPQVALRWLIQRGAIIIPKSTHRERTSESLPHYADSASGGSPVRWSFRTWLRWRR